MTASVHLSPAQAKVYRVLEAAASAGEPCPSNDRIAEATGITKASVSSHLSAMELRGAIVVLREAGAGERRVVIVETRAATDWARPSGYDALPPAPKMEPERPSRDACWRCETRPEFAAEFGCGHCRDPAGAGHPPGLLPRISSGGRSALRSASRGPGSSSTEAGR